MATTMPSSKVLFSTLNELVHNQRFRTREEAHAAVFQFIEAFYTAPP